MAYWLLKTDPDTYSFEDLLREKKTEWDGVRNHQARNNLAAMKRGDECLIYHSQTERTVVGTAKVVKAAYPDPEADDPRWVNVDVRVGKQLARAVTLAELKSEPTLANMALIRQSRLSVCPLEKKEWETILKLAER